MSEYLPLDVLDQIADAVSGFNDRDCSVWRPPAGLDPAGAPASGSFTLVTQVPCRWEAAGARAVERIAGPRFSSEVDIIVPLPRATDVQNDDEISSGTERLIVVFAPVHVSNQAEIPVLCRYVK